MFTKYLESNEFADVCLKIHQTPPKLTPNPLIIPIYAHRIILSAQSPFFAALFKSPCKDTVSHKDGRIPCYVITVPYIDAFYSVLLWLYTCELKLSLKNAFAISKLAQEWGITELDNRVRYELELLCTGANCSCVEIKHRVVHDLLSTALEWTPESQFLHHLLSIVYGNDHECIYHAISCWVKSYQVQLSQDQLHVFFDGINLASLSPSALKTAYTDGFISREKLTEIMFESLEKPTLDEDTIIAPKRSFLKSSLRSARSVSRISLKKVQFHSPESGSNSESLDGIQRSQESLPSATPVVEQTPPRIDEIDIAEKSSDSEEAKPKSVFEAFMARVANTLFPVYDISHLNETSLHLNPVLPAEKSMQVEDPALHEPTPIIPQLPEKQVETALPEAKEPLTKPHVTANLILKPDTTIDDRLLTASFLQEVQENLEDKSTSDSDQSNDLTRDLIAYKENKSEKEEEELLSKTSELLNKIETSKVALDTMSRSIRLPHVYASRRFQRIEGLNRDTNNSMPLGNNLNLYNINTEEKMTPKPRSQSKLIGSLAEESETKTQNPSWAPLKVASRTPSPPPLPEKTQYYEPSFIESSVFSSIPYNKSTQYMSAMLPPQRLKGNGSEIMNRLNDESMSFQYNTIEDSTMDVSKSYIHRPVMQNEYRRQSQSHYTYSNPYFNDGNRSSIDISILSTSIGKVKGSTVRKAKKVFASVQRQFNR